MLLMEPLENIISDHFPATLGNLFMKQLDPFLDFFRRLSSTFSDEGISFQFHKLLFWSTMAILFMLACLNVKMKKKKKCSKGEIGSLQGLTLSPKVNDHDIARDAELAEELQLQGALLDSLIAYQVASNASSSVQARDMDSDLEKIDQEVSYPTRSFCAICMEDKERWQMFSNDICSHTFCYECTSEHIVVKIQENMKVIKCPGVNCTATLDPEICRLMIPLDAVARWDELLCKLMIPDSQKLYCPFSDCSILLVDDSGVVTKKIECPLCKRSFCACCRVPWHSEFTCKEFQTLNARKEGKKEELMVKSLAKKKNWQKCPNCKMFVEKSEGCLHMTCRCGHEFCYRCGAKWAVGHRGCRQ